MKKIIPLCLIVLVLWAMTGHYAYADNGSVWKAEKRSFLQRVTDIWFDVVKWFGFDIIPAGSDNFSANGEGDAGGSVPPPPGP